MLYPIVEVLRMLRLLLVVAIFGLSACKSMKQDPEVIKPAGALYDKGIELLNKKKYSDAKEEFLSIYLQHPFSEISESAQILEIYSLYMNQDYLEATDVIDLFIKFRPNSNYIPYVYYMKAMSYYQSMQAMYFSQEHTLNALAAFKELLHMFPNTKYAKDAKKKIVEINNAICMKNLDTTRYYLRNKNPIAALDIMMDNTEKCSPEAKLEMQYRKMEAYQMLGLHKKSAKILNEIMKDNSDIISKNKKR